MDPAETLQTENSVSKNVASTSGHKISQEMHKSKIPTTQHSRPPSQGNAASRNSLEGPPGNASLPLNSARRAPSKSPASVASNRKPSVGPTLSLSQKRQLENQFAIKKKRYTNLRKELTDKQKCTSELHDELTELREKLISCGAKDPGKVESVKPQEMGFFRQTFLRQEVPEDKVPIVESIVLPTDFVARMEEQLAEIPKKWQEFCEETLDKHSTITTWLMNFLSMYKNCDEESGLDPGMIAIFETYRRDNDNLKLRFNEIKSSQNNLLTELIKKSCSLYEECLEHHNRLKEMGLNLENQKDVRIQLNDALAELQAERERSNQSKERRSQLESQLQKARAKTRELEGQLSSNETKVQQLQTSLRSLEAQLKQKDAVMEQRLKDMQRTMKSSEGLVAKMEKQRDTFESRVVELKEKMNSKEAEAMRTLREMNDKMDAIVAELGEEKEKRQHAEAMVVESEKRCKQLEEKGQQLYELAERSKKFGLTDENHTDNEVRLFTELQATRTEIVEQKEKIAQLERENEEIITLINQTTSQEDEDESRDRLVLELMTKTKELQTIMSQHKHLQKNAKILQETKEGLEKRLEEIQGRFQSQGKEGGKVSSCAHIFELQQQISDLRNSLAEAIRQNEEYETTLTQKQLQLEQRDRALREQSQYIKTRDELFSLINRKEDENAEVSNDDGNYDTTDEVNKQIAVKTEAIRELYSTLENKQVQVLRLEKMVKQMEDQQDRAQAQRTRLENRIAQLELEMLEKTRNNRYVKIRSPSATDARSAMKVEHRASVDDSSVDHQLLKLAARNVFDLRILSRRRDRSSHAEKTEHRSTGNDEDLKDEEDSVLKTAEADAKSKETDPPRPLSSTHYDSKRNDGALSSDEAQPYVCEHCRLKDKSIAKSSWSNGRCPRHEAQSFYAWLMDFSGKMRNKTDLSGDRCEGVDTSESAVSLGDGDTRENVDESSRESRGRRRHKSCRHRSRSTRLTGRPSSPPRRAPLIRVRHYTA